MKKMVLGVCMAMVIVLTACGSAEDMTDYVEVSFSGMDSQGNASYSVDELALIKQIFDLEGHHDYPDYETAQEAEGILDAYKVSVTPEENLSNGDEVKVTILVDEEKNDRVKGGEKTFTVEGLDEPEILTGKDVEENLVFNFNGVSGRGIAQIDNIFDEDALGHMTFQVENDGQLKNGDQAKIIVDKDTESSLNSNGYMLDDDFSPSVKVEGLKVVAEKATDIKNLEDLKRFMDEEFHNQYRNTDYTFGSNTVYEIKQEKLMYRQFEKMSDDQYYNTLTENQGNLIGVYSVKKFRVSDDEKKLGDEFTAIYGYRGIILDGENKANIAELGKINDQKGDNYSLKSVIQLYEGEGYTAVE